MAIILAKWIADQIGSNTPHAFEAMATQEIDRAVQRGIIAANEGKLYESERKG